VGLVIVGTLWTQIMKEKMNYKIRHIRMSDKNWEKLKEKRWRSKLSWNLFISNLLKNEQKIKN
jgi:hypothetical protein